LSFGDLKTITARTRVVVNPLLLIPGHIFDLYFIIVGTHYVSRAVFGDERLSYETGGERQSS